MEHIVISNFGTFLAKKSERLVIKEKGAVVREIPFFKIEQLTIEGRGVSLSSDLIQELSQQGIQINFLTSFGRPYAKFVSPSLSATIKALRNQIQAFHDNRGAKFAHSIVIAKMTNQCNLLRYFAKYRKKKADEITEAIEEIVKKMQERINSMPLPQSDETVSDLRQQFLMIEARVGLLYWKGVTLLLKGKVDFPGRRHAGATDVTNSALNYGYGFLYSRVWGAVLLAGLEPFAGFLHVDRPGKPSLVLDLVEEFRQPIVDRLIISKINRATLVLNKAEDDQGLPEKFRAKLAADLSAEFDRRVKFGGKSQKTGNIIQIQARNLASFFRDGKPYKPYVMKW